MLELLQHGSLIPRRVVVARQQQYRQPVNGGPGRTGEHVGGTRADGSRACQRCQPVLFLGKSHGGVHHGLFIARLIVRQLLPVLPQSLAQPGYISVPEDPKHGRDQSACLAVTLAVLNLQVFHQGLRHSQAYRLVILYCHRMFLLSIVANQARPSRGIAGATPAL